MNLRSKDKLIYTEKAAETITTAFEGQLKILIKARRRLTEIDNAENKEIIFNNYENNYFMLQKIVMNYGPAFPQMQAKLEEEAVIFSRLKNEYNLLSLSNTVSKDPQVLSRPNSSLSCLNYPLPPSPPVDFSLTNVLGDRHPGSYDDEAHAGARMGDQKLIEMHNLRLGPCDPAKNLLTRSCPSRRSIGKVSVSSKRSEQVRKLRTERVLAQFRLEMMEKREAIEKKKAEVEAEKRKLEAEETVKEAEIRLRLAEEELEEDLDNEVGSSLSEVRKERTAIFVDDLQLTPADEVFVDDQERTFANAVTECLSALHVTEGNPVPTKQQMSVPQGTTTIASKVNVPTDIPVLQGTTTTTSTVNVHTNIPVFQGTTTIASKVNVPTDIPVLQGTTATTSRVNVLTDIPVFQGTTTPYGVNLGIGEFPKVSKDVGVHVPPPVTSMKDETPGLSQFFTPYVKPVPVCPTINPHGVVNQSHLPKFDIKNSRPYVPVVSTNMHSYPTAIGASTALPLPSVHTTIPHVYRSQPPYVNTSATGFSGNVPVLPTNTGNYTSVTGFSGNVPVLPTITGNHTNSNLPQPTQTQIGTQPYSFDPSVAFNALLNLQTGNGGFLKFTDRPESFQIWKHHFVNGCKNVHAVTASQQINLLNQWLGPKSKELVSQIREANTTDLDVCLAKIWYQLDRDYGASEVIYESLQRKLEMIESINDENPKKLDELHHLLNNIRSRMESNPYFDHLFGYLHSWTGINKILGKLSNRLRDKWIDRAADYKEKHNVPYPPYSYFCEFIESMAKRLNDPSLQKERSVPVKTNETSSTRSWRNPQVRNKKTEVVETNFMQMNSQIREKQRPQVKEKHCPFHKEKGHTLNECYQFGNLSVAERIGFIRANKFCVRCCESNNHSAQECTMSISCEVCQKSTHPSALHDYDHSSFIRNNYNKRNTSNPASCEGGEQRFAATPQIGNGGERRIIENKCTKINKNGKTTKSCGQVVLVRVYPKNDRKQAKLMYAIIDNQSNRSLVKPEFMDYFDTPTEILEYDLVSCAGVMKISGRQALDFTVESYDGEEVLQIPSVVEVDFPSNRDEIPTPDILKDQSHLTHLENIMPELQGDAEIWLLIGKDVPEAFAVQEQIVGNPGHPIAQRTLLGWSVIGNVCVDGVHLPEKISIFKTTIMPSGRPSLVEPCRCQYKFKVVEKPIEDSIFQVTPLDEKLGTSVEDREFLNIMDNGFTQDNHNVWTAPLPFRKNRPRLSNNKGYVINRMNSLIKGLDKNPEKKTHMITFMQKIFDRNHAERAPPVHPSEEQWYLPLFGVYNQKKPGEVRVVFDSSAKFRGLSLNDVLITGPDLTNNLLGILLRFREEEIAVTADVEHMFHNFRVMDKHRNYLRFFWYKNNDPKLELVQYRMSVHVFGNTPSPAVATYGLRRSAEGADLDVQEFVNKDFYVDDGLKSFPSVSMASDILLRTQTALRQGGNLRLHKIASNNKEVLDNFVQEDLAKGLKTIDLESGLAPLQTSLGLVWDINKDTFSYKMSETKKVFSRRTILSTVHSLYDPIGFLAPFIIKGRFLLREVTSHGYKWDEALPEELSEVWSSWTASLAELNSISIPRMYAQVSIAQALRKEIHIFSDASRDAIAAVAFYKLFFTDGSVHVSFLLGKAKVAPDPEHTIPRLELCAAVLAIDLYQILSEHLNLNEVPVVFYTDSKVVLGYINNEKRRFFVYVGNRVAKIRKFSQASQWKYVSTSVNPADCGTRGVRLSNLMQSPWFHGPEFLWSDEKSSNHVAENLYPLVESDLDKEVKAEKIVNRATRVKQVYPPVLSLLSKCSTWKSLFCTVAILQHQVESHREGSEHHGFHVCSSHRTIAARERAEITIIKLVQSECFPKEMEMLRLEEKLPVDSSLVPLTPYLDLDGILRVGGRLRRLRGKVGEKHPIIMPKRHYVTILLIEHFHVLVKHQGRHITEGAIRSGGFWIIGGRRLIANLISNCVTCKRIRGKLSSQRMGDLPQDRIQPSPPFSYVGVDVFGPWEVTARRTRGGYAHSKRWAVMFSCLTSRAVHIEVIEEMSASSFINALRRLISLRGPVKQIRSDRGTNFIGAVKELKIQSVFDEGGAVEKYLTDQGCTWIFNPPHASHMGGAWERMIGVARRILEVMFLNHKSRHLTHEVLVTFMAEVCAIINSRPLVPVSSDPEDPFVLTPNILLTQKTNLAQNQVPDIDIKESYRVNWKYVQILAEDFWKRWQKQYLQYLQVKRRWTKMERNMMVGDVVLMKQYDLPRYQWPLGIVTKSFPGEDGLVRKVEIQITNEGKKATFVRPVNELVYLV